MITGGYDKCPFCEFPRTDKTSEEVIKAGCICPDSAPDHWATCPLSKLQDNEMDR